MGKSVQQWCVEYLYHMCVDDEGTCEWLMREFGMTEEELMEEFSKLNKELNLGLTRKVDNKWTDTPL